MADRQTKVSLIDDQGDDINSVNPLPVEVISGGGTDPVGLKNTSGTPINPATQETLALIKTNTDKIITDALPAGSNLIGKVQEAGLDGTGVEGTLALASANTWYQCPPSGSVPAVPYLLEYSFENAAGTIRRGWANASTPSATYGRVAEGNYSVYLAANEFIYLGSSTAGDDVNWGTKNIQ